MSQNRLDNISKSIEKKKLHITTYGCQMNVYDSQKMADLLYPHGFELCENQEAADVVILNTCHIREKASEKVFSELGRIQNKRLKNEKIYGRNSDKVIVVAGCVAQAEGEEIFKRAPYVSIVVGPQSYHNLPQLLQQIKNEKKWAIDLELPTEPKFDYLSEESVNDNIATFLAIQEGCDKFCHFCVVPYTRGAEYSRSVSDIYREAQRSIAKGVKEITLLGQNVSGYHGIALEEEWGLGKLLKHLSSINGLERIRYITSHPMDMTDEELFEAHANIPQLMPYVHLPVQSGSNRILKAMNRNYTKEQYLEIISKFKASRPDIAFSSDFIVGYPGETEKDFEDTIELINAVKYGQCYSFKYSPRPGTPAAMLNNQVPENVKEERLSQLQALLFQQQLEFNQNSVGKVYKVLFDRRGKRKDQAIGKSPYMQSVVIDNGEPYYGKIVNVFITHATQNSLFGVVQT